MSSKPVKLRLVIFFVGIIVLTIAVAQKPSKEQRAKDSIAIREFVEDLVDYRDDCDSIMQDMQQAQKKVHRDYKQQKLILDSLLGDTIKLK